MLQKENAMPELLQIILDQLNKLSSFLIFFVLYFILVEDGKSTTLTAVLKCAPVISLGVYVIQKGFELGIDYNYSQMVLSGLFFSVIGDSLLNYDYFPLGMAAFGFTQIFYISAFEMRPRKYKIGIPLYVISAGMTAYVFTSLTPVLKIGLPIYAFLLTTMCWRAIARATEDPNSLTILGALGSVLFVISDTLISVQMFVQPFPYARVSVMLTYYCAQYCIAVSTFSDVVKSRLNRASKKLPRKFREHHID